MKKTDHSCFEPGVSGELRRYVDIIAVRDGLVRETFPNILFFGTAINIIKKYKPYLKIFAFIKER
ncbi:MAG: hypothetical protein K6G22_14235 [Lachnospiraceae bacterium]|nr:hypothetical protein [Lachnospiraceae bacterium]